MKKNEAANVVGHKSTVHRPNWRHSQVSKKDCKRRKLPPDRIIQLAGRPAGGCEACSGEQIQIAAVTAAAVISCSQGQLCVHARKIDSLQAHTHPCPKNCECWYSQIGTTRTNFTTSILYNKTQSSWMSMATGWQRTSKMEPNSSIHYFG